MTDTVTTLEETLTWKDYASGGIWGVLGFVLSPLSWWNDLLVNVPIALGFAWIASFLLQPIINWTLTSFLVLVVIGYWISNVVGFAMMRRAATKFQKKYKGNIWHDVAISIGYTALILLVGIGAISVKTADILPFLPSWVSA